MKVHPVRFSSQFMCCSLYNVGTTVLKIVIFGGKSSIIWSQIASPLIKICGHKSDDLPPLIKTQLSSF